MGIKLDWDIESEQGKHKQHQADQRAGYRRVIRALRFFASIVMFLLILAAIAYVVKQRWEQLNQQRDQRLIDTVQAEVAALRVGDQNAFNDLQQSATDDWLVVQQDNYQRYQTLKSQADVTLSGRILDLVVDGRRARVQVEEIIDGVPYVQTWFYWNYNVRAIEGDPDSQEIVGWYHLPPDYAFWGDEAQLQNERLSIHYRQVDSAFARAVATALETWLNDACDNLDCNSLPTLRLDVVPAPNNDPRWQDDDPNIWRLIIPSPYTGRARSDIPFDSVHQQAVATLLAQRLVNQMTGNHQLLPSSDAHFIKESIIAWLVGRFVQRNPETHLIQSYVDTYGTQTLTPLLNALQSELTLQPLARIAQRATLAELSVDWRDFVLWRLTLEDSLMTEQNQAVWQTLYDFSDANVQNVAMQRYNDVFVATNRVVQEAQVTLSNTGMPQLIARTTATRGFETGEEIIVFNNVNGTWLRAN